MLTFSQSLPHVALLIFITALGLIFGSFITALSHRLPRGISIAKGRSVCPACRTILRPRDLIPVVSWMISRGRCRVCDAKISARYPAIEVLMAALFLCAALVVDDAIRLTLVLGATPVMVALGVIDLEHRRLPNILVAILAGFAAGIRYFDDAAYITALISACGVFGFAVALDHGGRRLVRQGLGMGDAKLMAVIAIALPPVSFLIVFCGAGVLGVVSGLACRRGAGGPHHSPFGVALLTAFWVGLIAL